MTASWGDLPEWSLRNRPSDAAPGRADVPAERWAECANRFGPPVARHVGRPAPDTARVPRAAYDELRERQAETVANLDRALADVDALADERDEWRRRAASAEAVNPSRLGSWLAGFVSAVFCLGAWWAAGQVVAAIVRHIVHGGL